MKILILRFSSIGDIVLCSPLLRGLHHHGGIEVHFVCKTKFVDCIRHNPYVQKVHTFDQDIDEIIPQLKAEKFDYIIDLHKNIRSSKLKWALKKKSFTFNKINIEKWLKVNFKWDVLPDVHIVTRYFETLKFLGISYDKQGLDYFISQEDEKVFDNLPESFKGKYMVMVVGGAHFTKQIPLNILQKILDHSATPMVLLGGPDDVEKVQKVQFSNPKLVSNLVGKLSLNESAAIIKHAHSVISADTGLMHIAAAYKKKIYSFWGNTIPEFGMYPLLPEEQEKDSIIMEVKGLKCRPCSKIGYDKCPKGHFDCMQKQDLSALKLLTRLNSLG